MQFLRELLLSRNHVNGFIRYPSELKPVPPLDLFKWFDYRIPDSGIKVKFDEGTPVYTRLDRKSGASIRSGVEVGDRFADYVDEEVTGIDRGRLLEPLK